MLHAASVLLGGLGLYACVYQQVGEKAVLLIGLFSNISPHICQVEKAILVHHEEASIFQAIDCMAHAWFRYPHVPSLTAVEGSDKFLALIEEFQTTDDPTRVQEIFDQLLNFDNDNVLDLPLLFVKDMIVYNTDKIAGYDFSSTPMFFDVRLIQPAE